MGIVARLLKVPISIPSAIYETISIYLLLAIGLKGGHELAKLQSFSFFGPTIGAFSLGVLNPIVTFFIARKIGSFSREDAAVLAAHYGAGSAVTFAVVLNFIEDLGLHSEDYFALFLVLIEITGILVAFSLLHLGSQNWRSSLKKIVSDVLLNKSIFLLIIGLFVGWVSSAKGYQHVKILFIDLFKGFLCFFMLEMGLFCGEQIKKIQDNKKFILLFGIGMPIVSACLAIVIAKISGLSPEGATILAAIAASASYIAAPTVTRSILPKANLSVSLACALGVTFPFNILIGIPLYYFFASYWYSY